jgi:hypothetical protein
MVNIFDILNTEESRENYIKGLIYLSKAKENDAGKTGIEPEEYEFIQNAMTALSLPEKFRGEMMELINSLNNPVEIAFNNKQQALFFIREGIQGCYIDGEYHEAEKRMVEQMATILGIDPNTLNKLEQWVQEGMEWLKRGDQLIAVGD